MCVSDEEVTVHAHMRELLHARIRDNVAIRAHVSEFFHLRES